MSRPVAVNFCGLVSGRGIKPSTPSWLDEPELTVAPGFTATRSASELTGTVNVPALIGARQVNPPEAWVLGSEEPPITSMVADGSPPVQVRVSGLDRSTAVICISLVQAIAGETFTLTEKGPTSAPPAPVMVKGPVSRNGAVCALLTDMLLPADT